MDVFSILNDQSEQQTTQKVSYATIFMPLKPEGTRVFRIVDIGDPVVVIRRWIAYDSDAKKWVPAWGYNPNDKRPRKPITVAVKRGKRWEGDHRNDPIVQAIAQMQLPDEVKQQATKPDFSTIFSVIDLSRVVRQVADDGTMKLVYPDPQGNFPSAIAKYAEIRNEPAILELSGVPKMKDGVIVSETAVGKLYQTFMNLIETDPMTGVSQQLKISDYAFTMKRVKGDGGKTVTTFTARKLSDAQPFTSYYDLSSWPVPMPHEAISQLLHGANYMDVVNAFNIPLLPKLVSLETADEGVEEATHDDLFD